MKNAATLLPPVLALLLSCTLTGRTEETRPPARDSVFFVSPLAGYLHNEIEQPGQPGRPSRTLRDDAPEYGLFMMAATPRLVANNTFFNTDVNDTKVWGNIATLNLYGDPEAAVTWHGGVSHLWHGIDGSPVDITVTEPLAKAGLLFRVKPLHLSINPYVGYGWLTVKTDVTLPGPDMEDTEHSESMIYGVSVYWQWRQFYANAKYYREDNHERDEENDVFRLWGTAMFTPRTGLLGRFEHAEQFSTTDTSILLGPVFVF